MLSLVVQGVNVFHKRLSIPVTLLNQLRDKSGVSLITPTGCRYRRHVNGSGGYRGQTLLNAGSGPQLGDKSSSTGPCSAKSRFWISGFPRSRSFEDERGREGEP